jgi:hypothetical protein
MCGAFECAKVLCIGVDVCITNELQCRDFHARIQNFEIARDELDHRTKEIHETLLDQQTRSMKYNLIFFWGYVKSSIYVQFVFHNVGTSILITEFLHGWDQYSPSFEARVQNHPTFPDDPNAHRNADPRNQVRFS